MENYKEKYECALETIQEILSSGSDSIMMSRLKLRLQSVFPELKESEDEKIRKELLESFKYQQRESRTDKEWLNGIKLSEVVAWLEKQGNPNKEYHRVPSTTLKRLYMNEAKYELLKSDIMEGIVGDFEKGTTHSYLTIKIPMLLCPSNCAKGDKVKPIIVREE